MKVSRGLQELCFRSVLEKYDFSAFSVLEISTKQKDRRRWRNVFGGL